MSPLARTDSLQRRDADRLYRALKAAVESATAKGGVHTGDVIAARHPGGSCPRCGADAARNGRRPLHLVVPREQARGYAPPERPRA